MKTKPLELAHKYLKKAAEDEALLDVVIGAKAVSDEIFGFHCQQAAEKLLKAVLSAKQVRFGKTHDLVELIELVQKNAAPLPQELMELDLLNPFAVEYRYGSFPENDPPGGSSRASGIGADTAGMGGTTDRKITRPILRESIFQCVPALT